MVKKTMPNLRSALFKVFQTNEFEACFGRTVIVASICIRFSQQRSGSGLSVLNYLVNSIQVHVLVKDTGADVLAEQSSDDFFVTAFGIARQ